MKKVSVHYETPEQAPEPNWQALFDALEIQLKKDVRPVTVIFIDDKKSKDLNFHYRQKDRSTDVLSFEDLREIYVCPAVVKEESKNIKVDYGSWMTRIIVHGILHLEGFRHDSNSQETEMSEMEESVIKEYKSL